MENSEFNPVKLCLKIDLVSYPARAEGLGKYAFIVYFDLGKYSFSLDTFLT